MREVTMRRQLARILLGICVVLCVGVSSGCITQKQRSYMTATEPSGRQIRAYCTQRNTSFALFGENAELHKMIGMCGTFEGDSTNVGVNEEGGKALDSVLDAAGKAVVPIP